MAARRGRRIVVSMSACLVEGASSILVVPSFVCCVLSFCAQRFQRVGLEVRVYSFFDLNII